MKIPKLSEKKGLTLLELLAAITLICIALPLLYQTFYQFTKYTKKARDMFDEDRPSGRLFSRLEADLKNAVSFSSVPFEGDSEHVIFSSLGDEIRKVTYFIKDGQIWRKEEPAARPMSAAGAEAREGSVEEIPLAERVKNLRIEYAYQGADQNVNFLPYWMERRSGIPRALRMTVQFDAGGVRPASLLVLLPQGNAAPIEV